MIGPNMATMLAFVLTDAAVDPQSLDRILRSAVDRSFHCVSVEGHTSTNDTVLLLANGTAGPRLSGDQLVRLEQAITEVCEELAQEIARDAEGASPAPFDDLIGIAGYPPVHRHCQCQMSPVDSSSTL